mmetsp:Transcript_7792/g.7972  ORF Transcript_7792/g.7972 Transcript_7792/m.7972 type:complete len:112 (-) Transcript_7792:264-599(-)
MNPGNPSNTAQPPQEYGTSAMTNQFGLQNTAQEAPVTTEELNFLKRIHRLGKEKEKNKEIADTKRFLYDELKKTYGQNRAKFILNSLLQSKREQAQRQSHGDASSVASSQS